MQEEVKMTLRLTFNSSSHTNTSPVLAALTAESLLPSVRHRVPLSIDQPSNITQSLTTACQQSFHKKAKDTASDNNVWHHLFRLAALQTQARSERLVTSCHGGTLGRKKGEHCHGQWLGTLCYGLVYLLSAENIWLWSQIEQKSVRGIDPTFFFSSTSNSNISGTYCLFPLLFMSSYTITLAHVF